MLVKFCDGYAGGSGIFILDLIKVIKSIWLPIVNFAFSTIIICFARVCNMIKFLLCITFFIIEYEYVSILAVDVAIILM